MRLFIVEFSLLSGKLWVYYGSTFSLTFVNFVDSRNFFTDSPHIQQEWRSEKKNNWKCILFSFIRFTDRISPNLWELTFHNVNNKRAKYWNKELTKSCQLCDRNRWSREEDERSAREPLRRCGRSKLSICACQRVHSPVGTTPTAPCPLPRDNRKGPLWLNPKYSSLSFHFVKWIDEIVVLPGNFWLS